MYGRGIIRTMVLAQADTGDAREFSEYVKGKRTL